MKASTTLLAFIVGGVFTSLASPYLNHSLIPNLMRIFRSREEVRIYSIDQNGMPSLDEKYDLYLSWGSTEPQGRMIEDGHEKNVEPLDYIVGGTHVSNMLAFSFRKSESTTPGGGAYTGFDYKNDGFYVGTLSGFTHDTEKNTGCGMSSRWAVIGDPSKEDLFVDHLKDQMVSQAAEATPQPSSSASKTLPPASQSAPITPQLPSPDARQPIQLLMNCPDLQQKSADWSLGESNLHSTFFNGGVEGRFSAS